MHRRSLRQLFLSITSLFIGNLSSTIFSFYLSLYVLQKTKSSFTFSLILVLQPIVNLLFSPITGYLVDKFSHKLIALYAQIISLVCMIGYILSINMFTKINSQIILIGLVIMILAICDSLQSTSYKASTLEIVIEDHQQKLVSYEQMVTAIITILAPILGGIAFGTFNLIQISLIELVGEVIVLGIILRLDFELVRKAQKMKSISIMKSFTEGLSFIKKDPLLRGLLVFAIFANVSLSSIEVGIPIIILQKLHLNSQIYGWIQSFVAIGMIAGSLILGSLELKKDYLKQTGRLGIMMTIGFLMVGFLSLSKVNVLVIVGMSICMLLIGIAVAGINLPYSLYVRTEISENIQGRVGSTTSSLVSTLSPVGYIVFGVLFNQVPAIWNFILCALILLIDSGYLLLHKDN